MSSTKLNIPGLIRLAAIIALLIVAWLLFRKVDHFFEARHKTTVDSTIVLEKIEKVLKLVTVEGNYSELMEYKDYQLLDIWGLRKKAIIKVKGKVLVGYDLKDLKVDVDDKNHVITFVQLPKAEIIAIDADLSYYNMEEGIFNSFNEQDLTMLNSKAKDLIRTKAVQDKLLETAASTLKENLDIITLTAQAQGWEVRYPVEVNPDKH